MSIGIGDGDRGLLITDEDVEYVGDEGDSGESGTEEYEE